jgi:8-amino-7-oxononanoate synthase
MSVASMLRANGILVGAIRPPTVPNNTARLRITICSEHSLEMLDRLIDALSQAKFECGL